MCGNDFLHSHSLPFPCNQFPFLPIPIPSSVTIPILIPVPMQVDRNIINLIAIYVKTQVRWKLQYQIYADSVTKSRNAQTYTQQVRTTDNVVAPFIISTV